MLRASRESNRQKWNVRREEFFEAEIRKMQVSLLILALVCSGLVQANTICDLIPYESLFFDRQYSILFSKLEEALIDNQKILKILKHIFMSTGDVLINFRVHLEVDNGTGLSSSCETSVNHPSATFCPKNTSNDTWELCAENGHGKSLTMLFVLPPFNTSKLKMFSLVIWLSLLHGNLLSLFAQQNMPKLITNFVLSDSGDISLRLKIDSLECNPPLQLTECVVSELLSWVGTV